MPTGIEKSDAAREHWHRASENRTRKSAIDPTATSARIFVVMQHGSPFCYEALDARVLTDNS